MVAVAAFHYRNAATPIIWLSSAVSTSADFPFWQGTTLTAGRLVDERPPWWYLPAWVGGSTPLIIAALGLFAMSLMARSILTRGNWRDRLSRANSAATLWVVQAAMLPTAAILMGSTMYAGLRQHLYILPALAALAGIGAANLLKSSRLGGHLILVLALVAPTVAQFQLFPFQFVYKNAIAGPIEDRWETDMHWVSARAALQRVPANAQAWCFDSAVVRESGEFEQPVIRPCEHEMRVAPFAAEQGLRAQHIARDGEIWVIGRKYRGNPVPVGCRRVHPVERRLWFETITISHVLICEAGALEER